MRGRGGRVERRVKSNGAVGCGRGRERKRTQVSPQVLPHLAFKSFSFHSNSTELQVWKEQVRGFRPVNCGDTYVTSQLPFVWMDRLVAVNRVSGGMQSHGGVRLESHPRTPSKCSHPVTTSPLLPFLQSTG